MAAARERGWSFSPQVVTSGKHFNRAGEQASGWFPHGGAGKMGSVNRKRIF